MVLGTPSDRQAAGRAHSDQFRGQQEYSSLLNPGSDFQGDDQGLI